MEMVSAVTITEPLVSVIVPTYNAKGIIAECLDSVLKVSYSNLEVIVIDDCSSDGTSNFVNENYPRVLVTQTKKNSGFAASANLGIKNSRGEIVVLLNMDTVVSPGWLNPMVAKLMEDATVGLVGSKILFPDGKTIQHAGGLLRRNGLSLHIGRGDLDNGKFEVVREVDYLCGASLGFRRSLLDTIGMFDENYKPLYYEDTDLAYRARAAGKKVVYIPDSVLTHKENISTGGLSLRFYYYFHKSRLMFVFKNYSFRNIFCGFFREEKRWLIEELPVTIRITLLKVYLSVSLILPWLLLRRIAIKAFMSPMVNKK